MSTRGSLGAALPSHSRCGFTLIEIMLVIVIITILIITMMFALFRPRMIANETSAIGSLKAIASAESQYATANGGVYGNLTELSATTPPYLETTVGRGRKSGYSFVLTLASGRESYHILANPTSPGKTGSRYFYIADDGIVRFNLTQQAESVDSPIE